MAADHLIGIEQFEADLWDVADNLRANSNLASNEYFMPILGLIFLRQATNRYNAALAAINEEIASGAMPERELIEADFTRRRALQLPEDARYDTLLKKRKDGSLGAALEEGDEDFDFEEALRSIHVDLKGLNEEAVELAARIEKNFKELGV